jgi:hypothetical protein
MARNINVAKIVAVTLLCAAVIGCDRSDGPAKDAVATAATPSGLQLKATTAQLMNHILDPQSDIVWAAVGSIVTKDGEEQLAPKNDEEWNVVRNAARVVAESSNLLLLAPHSRDQNDWATFTKKTIEEANRCVEAAEAKDLEMLFTAGGDLYLACTACHAKYVLGEPMKSETN